MKIAIIFYQYLDYTGEKQTIGGVQTYITALTALCAEIGAKPIIFQCSNERFEKTINNLQVVGVPVAQASYKHKKVKLYQAATLYIDDAKDMLIFGSDILSVKTDNPRHIAIQHGVSWDLPAYYMTKKWFCKSGLGAKLKKLTQIKKAVKNFENCRNRVCVDYNFLNWYRTVRSNDITGKVWVIPNFTPLASPDQVAQKISSQDSIRIRILFARRFMPFRGTRIYANAVQEILASFTNVKFTFAGEGPDSAWLQERFQNDNRVCFTRYLPAETLDTHLSHDISVVPSMGSEGTSLAVAEAMGAACCVIASAVGGITNMIIDNYNGLLCLPSTTDLKSCLKRAISSTKLRTRLQRNAYITARDAFSIQKWKERWKHVFLCLAGT